jgi:hypothetical protein
LIYVLRGSIQISFDADDESYDLDENGVFMYAKDSKAEEITDFTLVPLKTKGEVLDNGLGEAIILFYQIEYLPPRLSMLRLESPLLAHSDPVGLPPLTSDLSLQKLWNIPLLQRHGSKILNSAGLDYAESSRHYKLPENSERCENESEVPPPVIKDTLDINDFPEGAIRTAWINIIKQGLSEWIRIPVIVCRGNEPGYFKINLGQQYQSLFI